ncbi:MAG: hypothetical protein A3I14_12215 [Candidatus Rokubacteria bacterium RIFCSPLOWO2_02_FULL_73_56]|nr:MAG: hypothetical protein A3D33_09265 [Candidatus Rokubacteria bacterium RIFCSPHIGHO2_02_FULL_73_26]OGL13041.1 MAG: hypothetical protein A3I14_12215 [Candidatus Rokubacteria bacterium RIFCSPLOWO2_02_FULL_73_56]HLA24462.1 hypothetical protein [bacterium]
MTKLKFGGRIGMRHFGVITLLLLTACAPAIPADTPSALVPLGNREFGDFQFRVAPPPGGADVSACRAAARPRGWWVYGPILIAPLLRDAVEHARQADAFTDCLTKRGYAVERVDLPLEPLNNSTNFGVRE